MQMKSESLALSSRTEDDSVTRGMTTLHATADENRAGPL